jgi:hypothetical protein
MSWIGMLGLISYLGYILFTEWLYYALIFVVEGRYVLFGLLEIIMVLLSSCPSKNDGTSVYTQKDTSLIIPFGGSKCMEGLGILEKTINAASNHFHKWEIYLIHNGKKKIPDPRAKALCDKLGVNYFYLPIPSKTFALYYANKFLMPLRKRLVASKSEDCIINIDAPVGKESSPYFSQKVKRNPTPEKIIKSGDRVMMIDDDVFLPTSLRFPSKDDPKRHIWAYMIRAHKPDKTLPWYGKILVYEQDLEYISAGFMKALESKCSTTLTHHGAIAVYSSTKMAEVLESHDGTYPGEDYLMGLTAYEKGINLKTIFGDPIRTNVPSSFCDLYSQRVNVWDYALLKYIPYHLKITFNCDFKNFVVKLTSLYYFLTIIQDFIRIPIIVSYFYYLDTWINLFWYLGY